MAARASVEPTGPSTTDAPDCTRSVTAAAAEPAAMSSVVMASVGAPSTPPASLMSLTARDSAFSCAYASGMRSAAAGATNPNLNFAGTAGGAVEEVTGAGARVEGGTVVVVAVLLSPLQAAASSTTAAAMTRGAATREREGGIVGATVRGRPKPG